MGCQSAAHTPAGLPWPATEASVLQTPTRSAPTLPRSTARSRWCAHSTAGMHLHGAAAAWPGPLRADRAFAAHPTPAPRQRSAAQGLTTCQLLQGIRPAALQRVHQQGLAELIALCIAPQKERPHAKKLLKHPYFASIREVRPQAPRQDKPRPGTSLPASLAWSPGHCCRVVPCSWHTCFSPGRQHPLSR